MARKSLIEAGSILPARDAPDEDAPDVLSRVLERDRARSGRRTPASEPPNITTLHDAHITAHAENNEYSQQSAQPSGQTHSKAATQSTSQEDARPAAQKGSRASLRADAQKRAQRMAASPAIPITLRLPSELNDFLDDAAHARRKQGVKKQDLVSRAVQLLVVALAEEEGEGA